MRICMVAEGCYPYVVGGVSSWIHSMIRSFPDEEFIVLAIVANRKQSGKFAYELPPNVSEVYEAYLDDLDWGKGPKTGRRTRLSKKEYRALRSLILNQEVDWDTLFKLFKKGKFSIDDMLMGADFLHIVQEVYELRFPNIVFSDFLWTMRSIYMPLFLIMRTELPKADIYHCVATGYAGLLGSMAKYFNKSALLISEHGIYTREREEELLKANWVAGLYKNIWIEQFRKMSLVAYERADAVTALYAHAQELQHELGCPEEKTFLTPNGVDMGRFADLPGKTAEDEGFVNIGAVLRVTPIKDVKTMIRAFAFAKEKVPALKLWIMGPTDEDEEYARECFDLVDALGVSDVIFTGRINVTDYLGRMDFTLLTSISEGQPLTILEGFAAHKPCIATDVGCCRELIYGVTDNFGEAGILCHTMNTEDIAGAMVELGSSPSKVREMGEAGFKRCQNGFQLKQMKKAYEKLYENVGWNYGKIWSWSQDDLYSDTELSGEKEEYTEDEMEEAKEGILIDRFNDTDVRDAGAGVEIDKSNDDYDLEFDDLDDFDVTVGAFEETKSEETVEAEETSEATVSTEDTEEKE